MSDIQLNSNDLNSSISNSLYGFSQIIKNFDKINIKEIEPTTKNISEYFYEGDLSIVIYELVDLIFMKLNEGKDEKILKKCILNHIDSKKIITQEIYNYLLNNQNNSNSIYLLGYFNYYGIETDCNNKKAIELYKKALELENKVAQLSLAEIYIYAPTNDENNDNLAFKLSKNLAKKEYAIGINNLGWCYENGIGIDINEQKAFELYQKAADLGNSNGINNLGWCYNYGIGTNTNEQKAFELFQKAAGLDNTHGLSSLGCCYFNGVGTLVNKQKAFELYLAAANLENENAQFNIAKMYEDGDGTKKDLEQAIYWYNKSAEQGYHAAQTKLNHLFHNNIN
jgi:TPR repeat protein